MAAYFAPLPLLMAEMYLVEVRTTGMSLSYDVPIAGDLGDQQAATFGQACFEPGTGRAECLLTAHAPC